MQVQSTSPRLDNSNGLEWSHSIVTPPMATVITKASLLLPSLLLQPAFAKHFLTPPFLDLLLPLNMTSAEDLSYHHVSAGVGGNGAQSSPGINGSASQNGQPVLTKRKKGRKPKGLDGANGSVGENGANGTGNGGVGKRKSRESTFSSFNNSYNTTDN